MFLLFFLLFASFFISICHSNPVRVTKLTRGAQTIVLFHDLHETKMIQSDPIADIFIKVFKNLFKEKFEKLKKREGLRAIRNNWFLAVYELAKQAKDCALVIEELQHPWDLYRGALPLLKSYDSLKKMIQNNCCISLLRSFRYLERNKHLLPQETVFFDGSSFSRRIGHDMLKAFEQIETAVRDGSCWGVGILHDLGLRKLQISDYCDKNILGPTRLLTWKQLLEALEEMKKVFVQASCAAGCWMPVYVQLIKDASDLIGYLKNELNKIGISEEEQAAKPIVEMFFESMIVSHTGKPSVYGPKTEQYLFMKDFFSTNRPASNRFFYGNKGLYFKNFLYHEVDARMLNYIVSADGQAKPYIFVVGGAMHFYFLEECLERLGYKVEVISEGYGIGATGERYTVQEFMDVSTYNKCKDFKFCMPEDMEGKITLPIVTAG